MARKTVVGLGETLFDVFDNERKIGGAPANYVWYATQLGCRGAAVSAVGNDELGNTLESTFTKRGLECILQRTDKPTGTVQVTLDAQGIPYYEIKEDVAWDYIKPEPRLLELASKTDCVCFGS